MAKVLVLYDSPGRLTAGLAAEVAAGAREVAGAAVTLHAIGDSSRDEVYGCDALILGCPNWSGITGQLKLWLDNLGDPWEEGQLLDKFGAAFTTGASRSAGVEFTLLSLIHWLLAGGVIIVGLPFQEEMRQGGSYYGPTASGGLGEGDKALARALGRRVARLAVERERGQAAPA